MNSRRLHTTLELAYSPISNYEFYFLKQEGVIKDILKNSTLYVICQRAELLFQNITFEEKTGNLHFEIHKSDSKNKIDCVLPLYQSFIQPDESKTVETEFGFTKEELKVTEVAPYMNVKSFKFYEVGDPRKFLFWLTPDKFLHHYWHGIITAKVLGDYREFTRFHVHYVGESTDQEIWRRLTGHEKLQDILTLEKPFHFESLNTYEITLLLFQLGASEGISIFDGTGDVDEFVDNMFKPFPSQKQITLDVEKALINALKPSKKYNKIQYKNYPISNDGLSKENYDWISYKIRENISLEYQNVTIRGDMNVLNSSTIIVEKGKKLRIAQDNSLDSLGGLG